MIGIARARNPTGILSRGNLPPISRILNSRVLCRATEMGSLSERRTRCGMIEARKKHFDRPRVMYFPLGDA